MVRKREGVGLKSLHFGGDERAMSYNRECIPVEVGGVANIAACRFCRVVGDDIVTLNHRDRRNTNPATFLRYRVLPS